MQKAFFDNETANSIADPETYNRSNNKKVDIYIDHTSLPGGPNTSFVAVDANISYIRNLPISFVFGFVF